MKKTTILLGVLSISLAYGQTNQTPPTGKVGINTEEPKETLHVKGTFQVEELPAENEKIYKGQSSKTTNFQATKTVVANADGVLGTIPFVIPSGTDTNNALKWQNGKWEAVAPVQAGPTYTSFTSVVLSSAGNSFERAALSGDVSATQNSNDVSVNKIKGKAISATAPTDGQVLTWEQPQGQQGEWKPKSITEPWNVMGKTEPATGNTQDIYQNGKVGVGDFDDEAKKTHATASLNIKNSGDKDVIRILSDKANTANDLKAEISFIDSAGEKYALIGDDKTAQGTYDAARHFYLRTEKNYPLTVGSFGNNEKDRSSIEFMGDATATNGNRGTDVVKMRFFTGRWNDNEQNDYGVTTVSKHGNWFIGADMRNKDVPGVDKLTVAGSIRLLKLGRGISHNQSINHNSNNTGANVSEKYYNNTRAGIIALGNSGHLYATIETGSNTDADKYKWRQLDNVDYNGTNGITVNNTTGEVSLPTGTDGQVLKWNNNAWTASSDANDKSPWFVAGGDTPAKESDNKANNSASSRIYYPGNVGLGFKFNSSTTSPLLADARLLIDGTDNHLILNTSGAKWKTSVGSTWYRLSHIDGSTEKYRLLLNTNGNFFLHGGGTEMSNTGADAGLYYTSNSSKLTIDNSSADEILTFKSKLANNAQQKKQFIGFYRGRTGSSYNQRSGFIGYPNNDNDNLAMTNETGGNIVINSKGGTIFLRTGDANGNSNMTEVNGQLKIHNIQQGNRGDVILVGSSNLVKYVNLTQLLPVANSNGQVLQWNNGAWTAGAAPATATEPWFVVGGTTQATNSNNNGSSNIYFNGNVGIGDFGANKSIAADFKLEVKGRVKATSFVGAHGAEIFPDYVFQKYYTGASSIKADYNFQTLSQVEAFVKANGHLPGYKSAAKIKEQGYIDVMETQLTNVEKIEELYLHSIEQDKALKAKDAEIAELKARLDRLEKLLK